MLRLKIIACDVLNREISYLSSQSECFVDVTFLHQGLHCIPDKLNKMPKRKSIRLTRAFHITTMGTGLIMIISLLAMGFAVMVL